jgi:hypothetical protein
LSIENDFEKQAVLVLVGADVVHHLVPFASMHRRHVHQEGHLQSGIIVKKPGKQNHLFGFDCEIRLCLFVLDTLKDARKLFLDIVNVSLVMAGAQSSNGSGFSSWSSRHP